LTYYSIFLQDSLVEQIS